MAFMYASQSVCTNVRWGLSAHFGQVERRRVGVAVEHDDAGVRGDAPARAALLYASYVMSAEAPAAEHHKLLFHISILSISLS